MVILRVVQLLPTVETCSREFADFLISKACLKSQLA